MRKNDVVAVGEENNPPHVELVTKSEVSGVGVRTAKLTGFLGSHNGAMTFEFEIKREKDGLHVWEDCAEDEVPHLY